MGGIRGNWFVNPEGERELIIRYQMWLSQVDTLSSKQTPDARKTRFSLFGFNLTQARAADDELWCVYDPVFDLFLPCEPAA